MHGTLHTINQRDASFLPGREWAAIRGQSVQKGRFPLQICISATKAAHRRTAKICHPTILIYQGIAGTIIQSEWLRTPRYASLLIICDCVHACCPRKAGTGPCKANHQR